jgi:phenylacetate-CoA ligase
VFTSLTKEAMPVIFSIRRKAGRAVPGVAPHFQLELSREGRLDRLMVRVEARPGADGGQRTRAEAAIRQGIKDGIGVSVEVAVVDPETLERSVGKIRRVVDNR